jgi:hypothetical protein
LQEAEERKCSGKKRKATTKALEGEAAAELPNRSQAQEIAERNAVETSVWMCVNQSGYKVMLVRKSSAQLTILSLNQMKLAVLCLNN